MTPILTIIAIGVATGFLLAAFYSIGNEGEFLSNWIGASFSCSLIGVTLFGLVKLIKWMWTA